MVLILTTAELQRRGLVSTIVAITMPIELSFVLYLGR
jgi:hypothetical protein